MLDGKSSSGFPVQLLPKIHALRRDGRVEKEGPVFHRDWLALPILQRPLQMPLSNAAERSDRVVINGNLHYQDPCELIETTILSIVLLPAAEDRPYAKPG